MTEEKKQTIMNCETFDELLDQEYGPQGTPERASFETEAEAFCLAETFRIVKQKVNALAYHTERSRWHSPNVCQRLPSFTSAISTNLTKTLREQLPI